MLTGNVFPKLITDLLLSTAALAMLEIAGNAVKNKNTALCIVLNFVSAWFSFCFFHFFHL